MAKKRIMVVEDESITAMNIKQSLEDMGYDVTSIVDAGEDVMERVKHDRPDLVLMDIALKGKMDGVEAAEQVFSQYGTPIVYLTAHLEESMMKHIKLTEPFGYIVKPFDEKELRMTIEIAFYKYEMESRLKESENKFREVVEGIGDIVTTLDGKLEVLYVNHVAENMFGIEADQCLGMSIFQFIHPDDKHSTSELFANSVNNQIEYASIENRLVNFTTGEVHHMLWNINFHYDEKGKIARINGIASDITDRKKFEEHLRITATTDDLTGLLNRRGFFALADQQRKLVDRTKRHMSLLYMDIDGFKNINDELGHREGDNALIDTANILRDTFRESDIVARIGGDEFAVLLTGDTQLDADNVIIGHLRNKLEEFNTQEERGYELLYSIGIANYDYDNRCSIDELLMHADDLMYKDKKGKLLKDLVTSLKSEDERRGYKRYSDVEDYGVIIDGFVKAAMKDISYGGACLKSQKVMNTDNIYKIKMVTPDNKEIFITGLVVWMSLKGESTRREKNLSFYEMGIRFIDMNRNEKSLLKKLIKKIAG